MEAEIHEALVRGIPSTAFVDLHGGQISLTPHPTHDGYVCPAFDPTTHHCRIYDVRPLDCQLYPFAIMWNEARNQVLFGWDPLCPFLTEQPEYANTQVRESDHFGDAPFAPPNPLPSSARKVAMFLESSDVLQRITAHPQFITDFQPDVVILQPLNRLTEAMHTP